MSPRADLHNGAGRHPFLAVRDFLVPFGTLHTSGSVDKKFKMLKIEVFIEIDILEIIKINFLID